MSKPKDKAYHADGTMTAAEFKRRFMNKAARLRSVEAVAVRSNIGVMKHVHKDKQRLRNSVMRSAPNPGSFYSTRHQSAAIAGESMAVLRKDRNASHIRSSF